MNRKPGTLMPALAKKAGMNAATPTSGITPCRNQLNSARCFRQ